MPKDGIEMKKQYFLQFDFWATGVKKFWFGIIETDIDKTPIIEVCRTVIKDTWPNADFEGVEIKVNAFNNIDT